MSDAARVGLYYLEESTWGTTPASALKLYGNALSETFKRNTSVITTDALGRNYVRPWQVRNKTHGVGGFNFELAYGDPDDFLEGALRSDWSASISTSATDISADTSDDSFNRVSGSFVTDGFVVGMWVKVSGWTTTGTGNNGYWRILSVAALKITVDGNLSTKIAGDTVVIKNSGMLRNGTTGKFYTIERAFPDLTNRFIVQKGMYVGGVNMEWTTDAPVRGAFSDFVGKAPVTATATAGTGAAVAAPTTRVMNGIDEIYAITEGGTVVTVNVTRLSFDFKGGLEPLFALGSAQPFQVGMNSFTLTGQLTVYLDDAAFALLDKNYNFTASKLWWRATDAAGNTYQFTFPALRYVDSDANAGGVDQRTYLSLPWAAELDSVTNSIMQIDRIAA